MPGAPRRTVRMIAGHIHNTRCMWIKTLGNEHGIVVPRSVNRHKVEPKELLPALRHSSRGIINLLSLGFDPGGAIPISSSYTWRNLSPRGGACFNLFRCAGRSPSWADSHARTPIGLSFACGGYGWSLAMVEARQGGGKLDFVDAYKRLQLTAR